MHLKNWLFPSAWRLVALLVSAHALAAPAQQKMRLEADSSAVRPEVAATIVVYNEDDRDSVELARFYAGKRGIAKEHLVGLRCPVREEITREEYDLTIAEPLRAAFQKNDWWTLRAVDDPRGRIERNRIRFVALIRGIPLKIAATSNYLGDRATGLPLIAAHNEAAVDSELATLGAFTRVISGLRENPLYRSFTPILDTNYPEQLLVCRLDAPTPEMVKRMITDSLAIEQEGLRGFAYVDARGTTEPGLRDGDTWLYSAAAECRRRGLPTVLDNGEALFPDAYPLRQVALYYGWYSGGIVGPFAQPDFRFNRGAVAVHIHSFSANTLRDPRSNWCGPLLASGAAATCGNVYEPYLGLTLQIDLFNDRLLRGFTFAESAWMAVRALSWQTTMIGDPLYRPFKVANEITVRRSTNEWDLYRDGARLWHTKNSAAGEAALFAAAKKTRSGVIWEGLGLLELTLSKQEAKALAAFEMARKSYSNPEDSIRATIHQIFVLRSLKRDAEAVRLIRQVVAAFPKAKGTEVLRALDPSSQVPPP